MSTHTRPFREPTARPSGHARPARWRTYVGYVLLVGVSLFAVAFWVLLAKGVILPQKVDGAEPLCCNVQRDADGNPVANPVYDTPPRTAPTAAPAPSATVAPASTLVPASRYAGRNWTYDVTKVERYRALYQGDYSAPAPARGVWVVVYVTVTNTGSHNFGLHGWDFKLHDIGGVTYDQSSAFAASWFRSEVARKSAGKLAADADQVPPGVAVTIPLVFEVGPAAEDLTLELAQEGRALVLPIPTTRDLTRRA